ncbi:hypothetical protein QFZ35_003435 [Arthrobacter ulcerisalmonis]|nr:hypothetical protein [Arthrobacter ulcerisalmonis]MDQ0664937.1 hypothetical protein [Arthrobacter ulcerisalmonis]
MTELTEPDDATAQPAPEWPQPGAQVITDPQVAQALATLPDIPGLPAADHESVYNGLHDELLAALNSDPPDGDPSETNPVGGAA